uniref:Uncharacterized protein n=1 Tax=Knipowitschia caucasica TaxID=637954 RepID=A0AAV2LU40_KNICA
MMGTLSREDLNDLFPGPENFIRRKAVWQVCQSHSVFDEGSLQEAFNLTDSCTKNHSQPKASTPEKAASFNYRSPAKVVKLLSPDYVLYVDTDVAKERKKYFELAKIGKEGDFKMNRDLRCRLIRNTMTSMIAILRATGCEESKKYPDKPEIILMAKRMVQYYPMLEDRDARSPWTTVYKQLYKRLQNMRSPQKSTPGKPRNAPEKPSTISCPREPVEIDPGESTIMEGVGPEPLRLSRATTFVEQHVFGDNLPEDNGTAVRNLDTDLNTPEDSNSPPTSSPAVLAKHYKTLQTLFQKKNPNPETISHLLDLEFTARRAFMDSNTVPEESRHIVILDAYPCFKNIEHVMDELRRILDSNNSRYLSETRARWRDFCQKVQFLGVWKKILKPPMGMDEVHQAVEVLRILPSLFPSASAPPKKLKDASEALLHVLQDKEDPNTYLKKRPLSSPVLLLSPSNCLVAIGNKPTYPQTHPSPTNSPPVYGCADAHIPASRRR